MTRLLKKLSLASLFCAMLSAFITPFPLQAQFIDLRLNIESKLDAETIRKMDFGRLSSNSGQQTISLRDGNVGIFSITALEGQLLLMQLNRPGLLHHSNPAIKDAIPVDLQANIGYSMDEPLNSRPISEDMTVLEVKNENRTGPWVRIYLFVYGTLSIGDIASGFYSNNIELRVEYI